MAARAGGGVDKRAVSSSKYIYIYIYIYIPCPPIKSLDFRGFDSSRLLILRDGNSHVR